jgi:hypothetical protein
LLTSASLFFNLTKSHTIRFLKEVKDIEEQEYNLIMHNYGSDYNDYMGVAIAFPKIFVLERVDREKIPYIIEDMSNEHEPSDHVLLAAKVY